MNDEENAATNVVWGYEIATSKKVATNARIRKNIPQFVFNS